MSRAARPPFRALVPIWSALAAVLATPADADESRAPVRPNILWITCEDMGPHLGCYGDAYSTSPHLDRFAKNSLRYSAVWSNAPVCAPARTALISGMYPTSIGAEHMRSLTRLPDGMTFFPRLLRDAGYYCSNNSKEDYNLTKPGGVWDESSARAHYRNRRPDQPFFAVFNLTITHESRIRSRPHVLQHDLAKAPIPKYHPDAPEVRHDWAQYYDNISSMDTQAGRLLAELKSDGLADSTIVWFFSDHGSGMPRNKRWPYNSGLRVPLLIHFPEPLRAAASKDYRPGGVSDRLTSFVDFGPTVLSLAGIEPPDWMQGHAFLGPHADSPRQYVHGFRGRMDERYDMVRSVRDSRYVYVRNYMPHLIYGQHLEYMFQTPTTVAWKNLFDAGKLNPEQAAFWKPKPPEELYDLEKDPDEVRNLAGSREHREILDRLRAEQEAHALRVRDVGFLPEHEIHARLKDSTPHDLGRNHRAVPLDRIQATAGVAASMRTDAVRELLQALQDPDGAVRYWGALGLRMRGREVVRENRQTLRAALEDAAPNVRIVAAEALARHGAPNDLEPSLNILLRHASFEDGSVFLALAALNAIDSLDNTPETTVEAVGRLPFKPPAAFDRPASGMERLVRHITRERIAPRAEP